MEHSATDAAAPIAVEVVQVRQGAVPLSERLTGTVRASGEVAIYSETSGPVIEVFAQNGDSVRQGDPLVRIRSTGTRAQLEQARSAETAARAELGQCITADLESGVALGDAGERIQEQPRITAPAGLFDCLRRRVRGAAAIAA
jgi:multidrug efflux pump subunit AcrA (membrane-fusion protein)